jgi:hypothetical protein
MVNSIPKLSMNITQGDTMISGAPRTGWFTATNPAEDYYLLKKVAARSVFGNNDRIDMLDLVGLEDDFRNGKYEYRDYYIGLIDGRNRGEQAKNAVRDLNNYLKVLGNYKKKYGSFDRLAAVRFHQTDYRIDRAQYETKPAALAFV